MLIEPHCSAMCLQQSRSASVISAPGVRHAIAGRPSKAISSRTLASWRTVFTYQIAYAQFGTTEKETQNIRNDGVTCCGYKVLLVRRNQDILCSVIEDAAMQTRRLILEKAGYTVTQARDLRKIETECQNNFPDCPLVRQRNSVV